MMCSMGKLANRFCNGGEISLFSVKSFVELFGKSCKRALTLVTSLIATVHTEECTSLGFAVTLQ